MKKWDKETQDTIVKVICEEKQSKSKVANSFGVPVKTVENWITKYNKNKYIFDTVTKESLVQRIRELEIENDILKKQYPL